MWRLSDAGDDAYRSLVEPLWSVAAAELWLRAVRGDATSARPRGAVA